MRDLMTLTIDFLTSKLLVCLLALVETKNQSYKVFYCKNSFALLEDLPKYVVLPYSKLQPYIHIQESHM